MIPRQLEEVARQHAEMMASSRRLMPSQRRSPAGPDRERDPVGGEFRNLRQRTGWTLVAIGLRIAAATSR